MDKEGEEEFMFKKMFKAIGNMFKWILNMLMTLLKGIANLIIGIFKLIGNLFKGIGKMFGKLGNKKTVIALFSIIFVGLSIYITTYEDTKAPVIKLKGDKTIKLTVGKTYKENGATVADNSGEKIKLAINSDEVDTSKVGTYEVTYTAKDSNGNKTTVVRTVKVVAAEETANEDTETTETETEEKEPETTNTDSETTETETTETPVTPAKDTTRPIIIFKGTRYMSVEVGSKWIEPGAYGKDNSGERPTVKVYGTVDTSKLGTYRLVYVTYDSAGNKASCIRVVTVVDTTAPVITLLGESTITMNVGDTWMEPGATVVDNSGEKLTIITANDPDTTKAGTYTVSYTATDSSGNTRTITRTVVVVGLED